jgi:teichuronic acid biosynthesis glycosyltransferase TuaC
LFLRFFIDSGMRVLAITNNLPHQDDSVCGIFAARQFLELKRQGADISVLVINAFLPWPITAAARYRYFRRRRLLPLNGIELRMVHFVRPPGRYALLIDGMLAYWRIRRLAGLLHRQHPFSIIYARGLWLPAELGLRLGRALGIPVLGMATGSDVNVCPEYGPMFHRRFLKIATGMDRVMATGARVARKLESVTRRPCQTIGGLVDLDSFCPVADKDHVRDELGLPRDAVVILFAGHVIEAKGVKELLEAYERIVAVHPGSILVMCGDGALWQHVKRLVQLKGLGEKVLLPGAVVPAFMPAWMKASDIFVLPSHEEGMPNAVMEAMACGLPVVSTKVGGLPDALADTEGAILIEPRDAVGLADALLKVLTDGALRKRMSGAARRKAEDCFGITGNTRMLMQRLRQTSSGESW